MKTRTLFAAVLSLALLAACLPLGGCQQAAAPFGLMPVAQHKADISVISDAATTINDEDLGFAAAIAQQPGARPLPDLNTATTEQRTAWFRAHQERHDKLRDVLATQPSP